MAITFCPQPFPPGCLPGRSTTSHRHDIFPLESEKMPQIFYCKTNAFACLKVRTDLRRAIMKCSLIQRRPIFRPHRNAGFSLQPAENSPQIPRCRSHGYSGSDPIIAQMWCFSSCAPSRRLYRNWSLRRFALVSSSRLIATTRVTAVAAAQESMTAIEGKASAPSIGKALRAPLTGSIRCFWTALVGALLFAGLFVMRYG